MNNRPPMLLVGTLVGLALFPMKAVFCQSDKGKEVLAGKRLYTSLNCAQCHSLNNAGGCLGPPLDQVTKRRSAQYLQTRLSKGPKDAFTTLIHHAEVFPHPRFRPEQVRSLIAYLHTFESRKPTFTGSLGHKIARTLTEEKLDSASFRAAASTPSSLEGRRLFLEAGCLSCHSIGNTGGSLGPALDNIGSRHSRAFIEAHITDPQAHIKATRTGRKRTRMIQSDLFEDQVKNIADYLLTLPAAP